MTPEASRRKDAAMALQPNSPTVFRATPVQEPTMTFFRSPKRKSRKPRFADPIAQAMSAGDRRSGDVMWFGGVSFRMEGEAR
jgi:hypothetical protein